MADMDSDGHLFPASFEFKIVWINFYDINYITGRIWENLIENSHLDRESCLAPQFYFLVDNNIQTDRADWGLRVKNLSHELFINESLNYCSLSFKYLLSFCDPFLTSRLSGQVLIIPNRARNAFFCRTVIRISGAFAIKNIILCITL